MHKLYEYACDELKELEKKAPNGLSAAELEYADKLTELKKNILKIEMLEGDSEYSGNYNGGHSMRSYRRSYDDEYHGGSYTGRRNARRDSMGRYSGAADEIIAQLEDMERTVPNDGMKRKIRKLIEDMENA